MALFLRAQHLKEFSEWMPAEVREEVVAEGMNRVSIDKSFAFWLAAGVLSVGIGLGLAWGAPAWSWWMRAAAFVGISALVEWPLIVWQKRVFLRSFRGVLREKGVNICTSCAYSLEGLREDSRCPECGADVAAMPRVGELVFGFLRNGSLVTCAKCGYDLAGLKAVRACPECGGPIAGLASVPAKAGRA